MINAALQGDKIARSPDSYLALATEAAQLERAERYISAQEVWLMASKAATKKPNREWALQRAELCHTCIHRFGKRVA